MNNNNKLVEKLRLYRTENIGPATYRLLLSKYKLEEAIEGAQHMALMGGKNHLKVPSIQEIEEEMQKHEAVGASIMNESDDIFPKDIKDFPPILSVLGNIDLLKKERIAVIGTRLPSLQGLQYTKYITEILGQNNYVVTSGFAKGIDTIVHENSLKTGTIAVLPCGIDVIFPSVNMLLYAKIKEQGLLITDRPFGQNAIAKNFPQRNKLLTQLSKGIVITEATLQSGSMMTASFAKKLQKPVFCVPGHPIDTRYSGNNYLIKQGSILIESPETIIEYFKNNLMEDIPLYELTYPINSQVNDTMRIKVKNLLSSVPIFMEDICIHTGYDLGEVNYILLELELAGVIEKLPNGQVCLVFLKY